LVVVLHELYEREQVKEDMERPVFLRQLPWAIPRDIKEGLKAAIRFSMEELLERWIATEIGVVVNEDGILGGDSQHLQLRSFSRKILQME
jgi:hypothetical protein